MGFLFKKIYCFLIIITKISILMQTFYGVFKSYSEYSCLYSRPGYSLSNIAITTSFGYRIHSVEPYFNYRYFLNSTNKLEMSKTGMNKKLNLYYKIKEFESNLKNCSMNCTSDYYLITINEDIISWRVEKTVNFYEQKLRSQKVKVYLNSEDCSIPKEINVKISRFYTFIYLILLFTYLLTIYSCRSKENYVICLYINLLYIKLVKYLDIEMYKGYYYCHPKSGLTYKKTKDNGCLIICKEFPGKVTNGENNYIEINNNYSLFNNKIYKKNKSGEIDCIRTLFMNDKSTQNLMDIMWFNNNLNFPCVDNEHCLSLDEIINELEAGYFFKNYEGTELDGIKFYGKLNRDFITKPHWMSNELLEIFIEHNIRFFKRTLGNITGLNLILNKRFHYTNRPENCNNSQWKLYTSDCKRIFESEGEKVKFKIDIRKETEAYKNRHEKTNLDLVPYIKDFEINFNEVVIPLKIDELNKSEESNDENPGKNDSTDSCYENEVVLAKNLLAKYNKPIEDLKAENADDFKVFLKLKEDYNELNDETNLNEIDLELSLSEMDKLKLFKNDLKNIISGLLHKFRMSRSKNFNRFFDSLNLSDEIKLKIVKLVGVEDYSVHLLKECNDEYIDSIRRINDKYYSNNYQKSLKYNTIKDNILNEGKLLDSIFKMVYLKNLMNSGIDLNSKENFYYKDASLESSKNKLVVKSVKLTDSDIRNSDRIVGKFFNRERTARKGKRSNKKDNKVKIYKKINYNIEMLALICKFLALNNLRPGVKKLKNFCGVKFNNKLKNRLINNFMVKDKGNKQNKSDKGTNFKRPIIKIKMPKDTGSSNSKYANEILIDKNSNEFLYNYNKILVNSKLDSLDSKIEVEEIINYILLKISN